ncbi:MAG TPA: HAMP domain-containing histidine kinase [Candidatus Eubacterium faecale]|uniref:histidine kinase n=1 Tax=Candidatus Eubacterium faecale TaxID=2838568 RepID=A0A9D2MIF7_9FIRM|nr:HAMP domain-containing histidine kinase [Candidatus Eubacterium faecale]
MKNKEFRLMLMISAFATVLCFLICLFISTACAFISLALGIILSVVFYVFTKQRYRKIEELNDYLSEVCSGNYELAVNDNAEGELSILKNNLYKVMILLRTASEDAKKDKLYLADSLADISHQLKTPLTSMMIITEVLQDEKDEEKRAGFIRIIEEQLEKMKWLITTLLKLSKLDADTADFNMKSLNCADIIDRSINPFLVQAEIRKIKISKHVNPFIFTGDENWSVEALENIIKNCLEHTSDGGTLNINTNSTTIYNEIEISDNGSGIAKEDLPHIFERFYHGKNSSAESVGIGLALSKAVFSKENANIDVKSKEGIGTKFTIRFYKFVV